MSERLELLRDLINPRRKKLAQARLLYGEPLVGRTGEPLHDPADVKVALLLVHMMNPWETFRKEEEAFLRGCSSDTLNRRDDLRRL